MQRELSILKEHTASTSDLLDLHSSNFTELRGILLRESAASAEAGQRQAEQLQGLEIKLLKFEAAYEVSRSKEEKSVADSERMRAKLNQAEEVISRTDKMVGLKWET
ncbi:unnamed protein product [Protopolystoma xenopodis]|uniref:Uncharacterized protein n=1 Tax=Protopolystoma xenopodis TaxID=117903 RepID=A0A448XJK3_9PLAT|nr:unnamed protein product [Protopolystoma xenopodis]